MGYGDKRGEHQQGRFAYDYPEAAFGPALGHGGAGAVVHAQGVLNAELAAHGGRGRILGRECPLVVGVGGGAVGEASAERPVFLNEQRQAALSVVGGANGAGWQPRAAIGRCRRARSLTRAGQRQRECQREGQAGR